MEKHKDLLIIETEKNNSRSQEVKKLLKKFEEELKPLGITCKNWAKPR